VHLVAAVMGEVDEFRTRLRSAGWIISSQLGVDSRRNSSGDVPNSSSTCGLTYSTTPSPSARSVTIGICSTSVW
jgi:hypothetical protein